jgi:hypothetical protein
MSFDLYTLLADLNSAEQLVSAKKFNPTAQRKVEKSAKKHAHKNKIYLAVTKPTKHKHSWIAVATFTYQGDKVKHTHPVRFPADGPAPKLTVTGKKLKVTEHKDGKTVSYIYGEQAKASPAAKQEAPVAKAGRLLKHTLGHAFEAVADPFKKAYRLVAGKDRKEYRKEVAEWVKGIGKTESTETKQMLGTFKKVLTGQPTTREEKVAAVNQAMDVAKTIAIGTFYGSIAAHEGLGALLGTILSPGEEVAGMLLDGPLRRITKKLTGHEHGILPSAFYNKATASVLSAAEGNEIGLAAHLIEAILSELSKEPLTDDDIADALARAGLKPEDKDKIQTLLSKGAQTEKTMLQRVQTAFAVRSLLEEDARVLTASSSAESEALINAVNSDDDVRTTVLLAAGLPVKAKAGALSRGLKKLGKFAKKAGSKAKKLAKKTVSSLKKKAKKVAKKVKPAKPKAKPHRNMPPHHPTGAKPKKPKTHTLPHKPKKAKPRKKVKATADTMAVVKALLSAAAALEGK